MLSTFCAASAASAPSTKPLLSLSKNPKPLSTAMSIFLSSRPPRHCSNSSRNQQKQAAITTAAVSAKRRVGVSQLGEQLCACCCTAVWVRSQGVGYEAMWDSTFSGWGVQGVRGTLNRQCVGACLNDPGMPGCRSRAAGPHRQYVLHRLCNKALLLPGEMMIQGPSLPQDCLENCASLFTALRIQGTC